jgi:hypothetical protein
MYLSEERSMRFYRLFFGLLRFVNERYGINDDPLYATYEITDPASVREVTDVLWGNESIINEYLKENTDELTLFEKETVSAWRHHITSKFILYDMNEEHAIFMDDSHIFGVSGIACEISELIDKEALPNVVETTLIPYDGKIIYDTIISPMSIGFREGVLEVFRNEYDNAANNGGIITEVSRFIPIADEYALRPKESGEASDGVTPMPSIGEIKDALEERLHINVANFSIRDDVEMRHKIFLFGEKARAIFGDEREDEPEELSPLDKLQISRYRNKMIDNALQSYCLKDESKTSLYDVLKIQRANELKMIAKTLYIPGSPKLKKGELIEKIIGKVTNDGFIKKMLFSIDDEIKKLLATIAKRGYVKYLTVEVYDVFLKCSGIITFLCIYRDAESYTFRIPDELLEYIRKYTTPAKRRKYALYRDLADYATALTNLYGMVQLDDFAKIYNEQKGGALTKEELSKNLLGLIDEGLCEGIDIYHGCVIHTEVSEDMEYADYLEERHQGIEMFPLPADELLNYTDPYYYEETDEAKLLYAYIIKGLSSDIGDESMEAADFLDELHDYARKDVVTNEIMALVDEYEFPVEERDMIVWLALIYATLNNSRKWSINGWTPQELHDKQLLEREAAKERDLPDNVISFPQKKATKIGRNDPCPCGSGKKYKHCCGKNL